MSKMRLRALRTTRAGTWSTALLLAVALGACSDDDDDVVDDPADARADARGATDGRTDAIADVRADRADARADSSVETGAGGGGGAEGGGFSGGGMGGAGAAGTSLVDARVDVFDTGIGVDALDARTPVGDATDAALDVAARDAGGSRVDAADAGPVTPDATVVDASVDASDSQEAGLAPIPIEQFQHAQSVAWCQRLGTCCELGAQIDQSKCVAFWDQNYGPDNLAAYLQPYNGNFGGIHATYSPQQAALCVNLLSNIECSAQTAESKRNIYATCVLSLQGELTNGMPGCRTSIECSNGWCDLPADGGLGTCQPLKALGQTCSDPNYNGDQCNYVGVVTPDSLHCDPIGGSGTCVPGVALGQLCNAVDQACAYGGVCAQANIRCAPAPPLGAPYCAQFTRADAGP
jgi:hypothetical protein